MSAFIRRIVAKRILHFLNKNNRVTDVKLTKRLQEVVQLKAVTKKTSLADAQFRFGQLSQLQKGDHNEQKLFDLIKQLKVTDWGEEQHLKLEPDIVAKEVVSFIKQCGSCYGYTDVDGRVCKQGTVVVEFSSPNIAKPFHAGHLRSTVIGNYIANLYEKLGYNVVRLNYLGDWGTQFGLLAIGYQQYGDPAKLESDPMHHLFEVYVKINQKVLAEKSQNVNTTQAAGLEAFRKMENGDEDLLALWKKFRDLSIEEYSKTYAFDQLAPGPSCSKKLNKLVSGSNIIYSSSRLDKRLGVNFTEYHSESMYHGKSLEVVEKLKRLGLLKADGDGKNYVEVDTVTDENRKASILKSDGTTLYITRDVAALLDRYDKYQFDKIHYVVQDAQYLHFRQLIGIAKRMVDWSQKLTDDLHIRFGRVEGMSTRKGDVVFLKDILDEAQHRMLDTMTQKETTKISEDIHEVADILGAGAIIVQDLKGHRLQNYKFSWDRILNLKADSGISLQYTHARLCNLEANCGVDLEDSFDVSFLSNREAQLLLLHLARYEDVIQKSFITLEPYHTVQYLFQLCHFVNAAYRKMPVKNEPPDKAQAHLQLFHVSRITLANGMRLLGLKPLQKM